MPIFLKKGTFKEALLFLMTLSLPVLLQYSGASTLPLDIDEMLTWRNIILPFSEFLSQLGEDTQAPLYYLFLKFYSLFLSNFNDFWLRIPSLLFSGLFLASFQYVFSKRGLASTGVFFIVLIILLDSQFSFLSLYARPYSMTAWLIFMTIVAWQNFEKDKSIKSLGWLLIFSELSLLCHYLTLIPLSFLYLLLFLKKREELIAIILRRKTLFIGILGIFLLQLVAIAFQLKSHVHNVDWIRENPIFNYLQFALVLSYGSLFYSLLLLRRKPNSFWLVFIFSFLLLIAIHFFVKPILVQRYIYLLYPFLLYGIATHLMEEKQEGVYVFMVLILFLLTSKNVFNHDELHAYKQMENFKKFSLELKNNFSFKDSEKLNCLYANGHYPGIMKNYLIQRFGRDLCESHQRYDSPDKVVNQNLKTLFFGKWTGDSLFQLKGTDIYLLEESSF